MRSNLKANTPEQSQCALFLTSLLLILVSYVASSFDFSFTSAETCKVQISFSLSIQVL